MNSWLIPCLLVLILTAGCIAPDIQKGDPKEYELPGLKNTTLFYLKGSSIQVVDSVTNTTPVEIMIDDSSETSFRNPVAIDSSGNNVSFNISKSVDFGKTYARFEFERPFTGFIAYTLPDGQDFSHRLTKNGSIRVILPENFTTGTRFLGIAKPVPDNRTVDGSGREVLIWDNPYPDSKEISVKYYSKTAPTILIYFFIFLFFCSLLILGYYRFSINALRKKYAFLERKVKK